VLPVASLAAQRAVGADSLVPGARVRVEVPAVAAERLDGTLRWRSADSISFESRDHHVVTVPSSYVGRVDVFRGASRRRSALRGLLGGALVGAGLGLFVGSVSNCDYKCENPSSRQRWLGFFSTVGGVSGVVFGAYNPTERWSRVPLLARERPSPDGSSAPR
jgi:hypothetical protein